MIPCRNANCQNWIDPVSGDYCESCNPTPKPRKPSAQYDALEVRGIGIVSPRRILVHRPKSVRRNYGTANPSGVSYSDMRDIAELERRKRTVPKSEHGKTVAEVRAERRAANMRLLGIAGTLGENDRD